MNYTEFHPTHGVNCKEDPEESEFDAILVKAKEKGIFSEQKQKCLQTYC